MMSAAMVWAAGEVRGIPILYSPRTDDCIALVLLACFVMSAYALARSRKFLAQLLQDFILHRERASIFTSSTAEDMRYLLLLILQTCVLSGLCIYTYSHSLHPDLTTHLPSYAWLSLYVGGVLLYLLLKWAVYSLLGWTFFDRTTTDLWLESYSTLLYYFGFVLFPYTLFLVYFDVELRFALFIGVILAFFAKMLMFYKWIKLFCHNLYGCSLLILYFCALEIAPWFIFYRGVMQLNDYLIIKF